jgi:hypothetical protein
MAFRTLLMVEPLIHHRPGRKPTNGTAADGAVRLRPLLERDSSMPGPRG